jgi:chaperonin GroES
MEQTETTQVEAIQTDATKELFRYGKPFGSRLIVKADEAEEKSKGGIIIPETVRERPQYGTVLAIGIGVTEDIKLGDKVMFGKHAGVPLVIQDVTFHIMQEREIFMTIDEDEIKKFIEAQLPTKENMNIDELEAKFGLKLAADKTSYKVGETIKLSIPCVSNSGSAEIVVKDSKGGVLRTDVKPLKKGDNEKKIAVEENMLPGIIIEVSRISTYMNGKKGTTATLSGKIELEVYKG